MKTEILNNPTKIEIKKDTPKPLKKTSVFEKIWDWCSFTLFGNQKNIFRY